MSIVAKTMEMYAKHRMASFDKATSDPVSSQLEVLRGLLRKAAATEWGRRYDFAGIKTPQQYRERVPVADYETMKPVWHRAFDGDRDVTWPGHVRFFSLSSGTTAGNKLLPVTRDAIRSNRRAGADLMAFMVARGGAGSLAAGKFLYLGGSTALREKGRCLYGDASGIMGRHIPFYARSRYLPDRETGAITNWEEKIDRIVDKYMGADVCGLSACPSWAALLMKQMLEAGGRPVGESWPGLSFFVSYGMALDPYRNILETHIGRPVHLVDTYSSSEGGMSAIGEGKGASMRLIVDNGVFYEFIPAGPGGGAGGDRLHIGEVETGRDYSVVISTNGGFWAYPLGDVIRFESLSPPRISFTGRTQIYLSAFGEHVTLAMLENAIADACAETSAAVRDYTVVARYPSDEHPVPAHQWVVEFDNPPEDEGKFISTLDGSIREVNEDYDTHRRDDYGMLPPILTGVSRGTFYSWMKRKGKLGGQNKVPRVARSGKMLAELTEISGRLA